MTEEADPEFLALPPKQRQRIDRAFDRGLPKERSSVRKRRKLNHDGDASRTDNNPDEGGGFIADGDDEGGFIPDDEDAGGGFMVDDDEGGGGFVPSDEDMAGSPKPTSPRQRSPPIPSDIPIRSGKVPLSSIPRLLSLLNLPADEDVLNVFKASATGWTADGDDEASAMDRRRGRGKGEEGEDKLGVERKDFRAVCAAIMDGGEEDDGMEIDEAIAAASADSSDSGSEEDTFHLDDASELSSLGSDSEYGGSRKKTRAAATTSAKGKGKAKDEGDVSVSTTPTKIRRKKKTDLLEQKGPLKLVGRQREVARELWEMMKGPATDGEEAKKPRKGEGSAYVMSREEVKKWVREMGEMWTEDEITDMVTLFSTQHEGRGLSFDDFGQIMLRARVI